MTEKYDITDYLKDDKELQKAVVEEFLKENAELKAENARLKSCLQEIKTIAKRGFYNSQCNCGLRADIEQILQKITKAESKG